MKKFQDWAKQKKDSLKKFRVSFSGDLPLPPNTDPQIMPPTTAALQNQASGSGSSSVRSRTSSRASSSSFDILKLEDSPEEAQMKTPHTESTLDVLSKLRQSFHAVDHFRGRISQKNIPLTDQHKEVFNFLVARIESGALNDNEALQKRPTLDIIMGLLAQRLPKKSSSPTPTPSPSSWNPLTLASRGLYYAYNSASSLVVSSSASAPPPPGVLTDDFIQYLVELFQYPFECISRDTTTHILGKLNRWPQSLRESPLELGFALGRKRASEVAHLEPCVHVLFAAYANIKNNYDENHFRENYREFFAQACLALDTYYRQLKNLNSYLESNRNNLYLWQQPRVQEALNYYFDQRRYLYEIYSMIQNEPLNLRENKIILMQNYEDYIKNMYAREEDYTRTFSFIAFGYDKWTKIEAAMEQYRYLLGLPGDIIPKPRPQTLQLMRFAGEQGRLADLKAQGLYLGFGNEELAEDPFVPLKLPTRLAPRALNRP